MNIISDSRNIIEWCLDCVRAALYALFLLIIYSNLLGITFDMYLFDKLLKIIRDNAIQKQSLTSWLLYINEDGIVHGVRFVPEKSSQPLLAVNPFWQQTALNNQPHKAAIRI